MKTTTTDQWITIDYSIPELLGVFVEKTKNKEITWGGSKKEIPPYKRGPYAGANKKTILTYYNNYIIKIDHIIDHLVIIDIKDNLYRHNRKTIICTHLKRECSVVGKIYFACVPHLEILYDLSVKKSEKGRKQISDFESYKPFYEEVVDKKLKNKKEIDDPFDPGI